MSDPLPVHTPFGDTFVLKDFEPAKFREQLYGSQITIIRSKQHIKFESEYHAPDYLPFSQIKSLQVTYDPKKWLLWVGILLLFVIVGIIILYVRRFYPPWELRFELKKGDPVVVRARLDTADAQDLILFCSPYFSATLKTAQKKA
jgi:hypothetical protein